MKNKRYFRLSCLLITLLVIAGGIVWGIFTGVDRAKLKQTLDTTVQFSTAKIVGYDNGIANDRVKSLIRLLDKTEDLCTDMVRYASFDQSDLDAFVFHQRLTGILVLDEKLAIVQSSTQIDDTRFIWQDTLSKDYIQDLLDHPEATYTEQVNMNGTQYDFAIVSRKDASGLLLAFVQKEMASTESGDNSLESLFANYQVEMDGVVVACLEDVVATSNHQELIGATFDEFEKQYGSDFKTDGSGVFRVKANGSVWYGRQESVGNYTLFVLFPANKIFFERFIAMVMYVVLAILAFMLAIVTHSNLEKKVLQQSQKRLRIITAIGTAYSSIALIHLESGRTELIKVPEEVKINPKQDLSKKENQLALMDQLIDADYREAYIEFTDIETMHQRLEGKKSISITTKTTYGTWLMVLIVPQKLNQDGKIETVLLACRNVTAEKEKELAQEQNLRNALADAKHANQAKTNFLNSMSHDIRTPMNAIMGYTALATTHIDNQKQVMDYLKKISTSSKHLLSLINDILDMSRIESGVVKIDEGPVHLPDVIRDLCAILSGNLDAKQHTLDIDTKKLVHEDVITDKLRLNQVLLNIVSNAVKFTPVGGKIQIRIEEKPSKKAGFATYLFHVKDNGIGISKEFQKDIFDAFAREQTVTKSGIEGTGLGMAISKKIVDMMGGTITVESEPGKGTEFVVTVDFKISTAPKTEHSLDSTKQNAVEQNEEFERKNRHRGRKILLVEDNALNSEIAATILEEAGMKVDVVSDGIEAVERMVSAPANQYDVILMDIQMPKMDGYTATREIRTLSDNRKANIPILAMTANAFEEDKEKAFKAGMNGHISKPIDFEAIMAAFDKIFGADDAN